MTAPLYVIVSRDVAGTWYAQFDANGFAGWTRKKAKAGWMPEAEAKRLAHHIEGRFPTRWDVKVEAVS